MTEAGARRNVARPEFVECALQADGQAPGEFLGQGLDNRHVQFALCGAEPVRRVITTPDRAQRVRLYGDTAVRAYWLKALVHQHTGEPVRLGQGDQADNGGKEQAVLEREAEQVRFLADQAGGGAGHGD